MPETIRSEIRRILAGDRAAIAWLYDTFAPRLLRRLGLRFGAIPDREDLMQDTFLYLLGHDGRALARFLERTAPDEQTDSAFERFLWSAACGLASNRRRSLLRHPTAPIDEHRELLPTPGGEDRAIARDALERLGECLYQNGERFYLYFQLRYRDGLKPAEIVRATGWSRKKTYKLKQSLDEALGRCVEALELGVS